MIIYSYIIFFREGCFLLLVSTNLKYDDYHNF